MELTVWSIKLTVYDVSDSNKVVDISFSVFWVLDFMQAQLQAMSHSHTKLLFCNQATVNR